jgi:hypothetical protein
MEALFVLAVVGGGAYWFFRGNIRRGAEIMRANVFLMALERGSSVDEANAYAARDMSEAPSQFVGLANAKASVSYGGVRLAMVGDAYRRGMHPKLPFWERSSIMSTYGATGQTQPADIPRPDGTGPVPASASQPADFDSYYASYIAELKRLDGLGPDDLHMAEMMDDEGTKRAYRDGVPPQAFAAMMHQHDFGRQPG